MSCHVNGPGGTLLLSTKVTHLPVQRRHCVKVGSKPLGPKTIHLHVLAQ